ALCTEPLHPCRRTGALCALRTLEYDSTRDLPGADPAIQSAGSVQFQSTACRTTPQRRPLKAPHGPHTQSGPHSHLLLWYCAPDANEEFLSAAPGNLMACATAIRSVAISQTNPQPPDAHISDSPELLSRTPPQIGR